MWLSIAHSLHLPFYTAGQLDCVDGAAMQWVNGNMGYELPIV